MHSLAGRQFYLTGSCFSRAQDPRDFPFLNKRCAQLIRRYNTFYLLLAACLWSRLVAELKLLYSVWTRELRCICDSCASVAAWRGRSDSSSSSRSSSRQAGRQAGRHAAEILPCLCSQQEICLHPTHCMIFTDCKFWCVTKLTQNDSPEFRI